MDFQGGLPLVRGSPISASPAFGVGKSPNVAIDFRCRPMLFKNGLAEGIDLAERVFDVRPDRLSSESETANAREEIEMGHVIS